MQNRLAHRERAPPSPNGPFCPSRKFSLIQGAAAAGAEQLRGGLLGALVLAGSLLRRPKDQSARACSLVWRAPVSLDPEQPFVSNQPPVHIPVLLLRGPAGMETEKKLDSRCIVSLGFRLCSRGRQRTGLAPPEALPHGEGPDGDVTTFVHRSLLQQPVRWCLSQSAAPSGESFVQSGLALFTRNCTLGMCDPRHSRIRRLTTVLRVRTSHLRGVAHRRCGPWQHLCLSTGSAGSHDHLPFCGNSGRADSPCSGKTDSIFWKWDLDVAGNYFSRVPPVPRPAIPFPSRLLLGELILAHFPSDPRHSICGSHLTKSDRLSLREVAHTECVMIMVQATVNN